jgi:fumarate hydratase class II
MGEVEVPADALWGAQTQRAVDNFPVSGERIGRDLIGALGWIKGCAAQVNGELGVLDADMAAAIHDAAADVARGKHDDQFPVDVFQTGSGTSSNMNANEVIATLASRALGRAVHPNDHVNASQSSNDVFPSAIGLAAVRLFAVELIPALKHLASVLTVKAEEFAGVVKVGRTHLMDAVPVTLGQEFGGYAAAVRHGAERVGAILPRLGELPLGGTAVGTGLNAPPGYAARVKPAGCCGWSRSACTRSATTCAGWGPGRRPAWARSRSRTCSRARRSCRARSTRSSARRCARSARR